MCKISEADAPSWYIDIFTLLPTQHQFLFRVHTACHTVFSRANNFRFGRPLLVARLRQTFFQLHLQGQRTPQFLSAIILTSR